VLESVSKWFGDAKAVDDVSISVSEGEALVLLGPSGCGKTTTLRLVAGFERPDGGSISLGDRALAGDSVFVAPERRQMAVVFQSYALWPHMTVDENVAFGPKLKAGRQGVPGQVREALEMVRLGDLGHRYPHELSGGQQQRVALARALVNRPDVLLLDEPLSNLDTQLREDMRLEIKRLQRELDQTMIYVTHDQGEALSLADRVAVMKDGRIEQLGTPTDLYEAPRTRFVARALGPTNVVTGDVVDVDGGCCRVTIFGGHVTAVRTSPAVRLGARVALSVRPGAIALGALGEHGSAAGVVTDVLFLGDFAQYGVEVPGSDEALRAVVPGRPEHRPGDRVGVRVRPGSASVLEA
jgi:ABC-type Fe3+/spermidine/putrescine transport system ATPase subunit